MDIKNHNHYRPLDPEDFERMNVGRSLWNASVSAMPDEEKAKEALIRYINSLGSNLLAGNGFLFWGERGTGKTAAGVILAMATVAYNHTYTQLINRAYFVPAKTVQDTFWNGDWEDKKEMQYLFETVDLLIIDDLGQEWGSDYSTSIIEGALKLRVDSGKSLIVTTNLTKSRLDSRYGNAFFKLLLDANCKPIKCTHNWRNLKIEGMQNDEGGVDYA